MNVISTMSNYSPASFSGPPETQVQQPVSVNLIVSHPRSALYLNGRLLIEEDWNGATYETLQFFLYTLIQEKYLHPDFLPQAIINIPWYYKGRYPRWKELQACDWKGLEEFNDGHSFPPTWKEVEKFLAPGALGPYMLKGEGFVKPKPYGPERENLKELWAPLHCVDDKHEQHQQCPV